MNATRIVGNATIHTGDCLESLKSLDSGSVQTCITSPPYFGLRDYGVHGQIGLEPTPEEFVDALVAVFREVRRVLSNDGTLWLNLGDSYGKGKQLIGIPWRVAFALQADGWILRQEIIWQKPNPMPESVSDRCTKAHEQVFLLTKSQNYYCDMESVREPCSEDMQRRAAKGHTRGAGGKVDASRQDANTLRGEHAKVIDVSNGRNRRSVWTVPTKAYKGAHFATFPPALIEPCVLAGSRPNDFVLDPFLGSGTTAAVALQHGRKAIGLELNKEYVELAVQRIKATLPTANAADRINDQPDMLELVEA